MFARFFRKKKPAVTLAKAPRELVMQALQAGLQFQQAGRYEEAEQKYGEALAMDPDDFDGLHLLGLVAFHTGRLDAAIKLISRAVQVNPSNAIAFSNLGEVYRAANKPREAKASLERALSLAPNHAEAHQNLGLLLAEEGRCNEALACFETALSLNPNLIEARWAQTMNQLRATYRDVAELEYGRAQFAAKLSELVEWFEDGRIAMGHRVVGTQQPFLLAYQEKNNRDVLAKYGHLCARLMGDWYSRSGHDTPKAIAKARIKLGIICAYVHRHSVWSAILKGWLQHLDPTRFELLVFHLGAQCDDETAFAQARAGHFEQGRGGWEQWVEAILAQQPDVLLFPEIGMDPATVKLASLRLAPVQVASWGHPETSGLPTIDYFLSAEDFEPADAQRNYTERLVALPHLGCAYQREAIQPAEPDFAALGIDNGRRQLVCAGSVFKYLPQYDAVLAAIAARLPDCQFVFFIGSWPGHSENLRQRLRSVFGNAGLDFDRHAVFVPGLPRAEFLGLLVRATVYLDTLGFSGFNTAIQAIECALPVVTLEGQFMRGRLASGILHRLDLGELVARSEAEYIAMVVKLARDDVYRNEIAHRLRSSRHLLFDDLAPIRALEEFLASAATSAARS